MHVWLCDVNAWGWRRLQSDTARITQTLWTFSGEARGVCMGRGVRPTTLLQGYSSDLHKNQSRKFPVPQGTRLSPATKMWSDLQNVTFQQIFVQFLANVNSSSCSLYVIVGPSVVCRLSSVCRLSIVCDVRAPYSDDWNFPKCFYAIGCDGHLLTSR